MRRPYSADTAELPDLYITCFSKNGDSLDQWRGYCKQGAGVSIGFDLGHFDPFNLFPVMHIADVVYGRQSQIRRIVLWVQRFAHEYELDVAHYGREITDHNIHYVEHLSSQLESLFVAFKNPAFANEEEVRLIIYGSQHEHFEQKRVRSTDYFFVPYFLTSDIKVKTECDERWSKRPLPVAEIVVGPSPHSELTQRSIEAFLQENQIMASVRISRIPFRNFT